MEPKIILTKVSDSNIQAGSGDNIAVYKADNGLTVNFYYTDDGVIQREAYVSVTNKK